MAVDLVQGNSGGVFFAIETTQKTSLLILTSYETPRGVQNLKQMRNGQPETLVCHTHGADHKKEVIVMQATNIAEKSGGYQESQGLPVKRSGKQEEEERTLQSREKRGRTSTP